MDKLNSIRFSILEIYEAHFFNDYSSKLSFSLILRDNTLSFSKDCNFFGISTSLKSTNVRFDKSKFRYSKFGQRSTNSKREINWSSFSVVFEKDMVRWVNVFPVLFSSTYFMIQVSILFGFDVSKGQSSNNDNVVSKSSTQSPNLRTPIK